MPWRIASAGVRKRDLPVALDAAGVRSIGAGEHARQLAPAGAEQPRDADHFAGAQAEADVAQHAAAAESFDPQQLLARGGALLRKVIAEIAIGHQPHELGDRHVRQQRVVTSRPSRSTVTRWPMR